MDFTKIFKKSSADGTYTAGTLKYSLRQLLFVCVILLLAKQTMAIVCYNLVPTIKPLLLDRYGASSMQIALIISTLPSILNFILCPIISTVSDRTRTRHGRRTPYLIWSAPILALLLVGISFTEEIAAGAAKLLPMVQCNWSLWILSVLIVLFQIAYLFPGSVVYYLEAEVVPQKCLGQYLAIGQMVALVCSAAFSYFLTDKCMSHTKLVLGIFAVIYVAAYVLQFLFVKEGEFPPPKAEVQSESPWLVRTIQYCVMFFRQCFTRKIFIFLSLCTGLNAASNICRSMFNMLFVTKDLGIDLQTVGKIGGISSIVSACLIYFFGKLMDKTHPMFIYFLGGILVMIVNVFGYIFVWDATTYAVVAITTSLMYAFQNLANTPLLVALLPMDKFGQYASGNAMVNHITVMIASVAGGYVTGLYGYRIMFVWDFIVTGMATAALIVVFFEWKRYGGKNYKAPIVD